MNKHMTIHKITTCCCKMKTWQCDKILAGLLRSPTGYEVLLTYGSEVQGRGFNFWQRRSRFNGGGMNEHWPSDVPFSNYLAWLIGHVCVSMHSSWKKVAVLAMLSMHTTLYRAAEAIWWRVLQVFSCILKNLNYYIFSIALH